MLGATRQKIDAEYVDLRLSLAAKGKEMRMAMLRPDRCLHFLKTGRLVRRGEGREGKPCTGE